MNNQQQPPIEDRSMVAMLMAQVEAEYAASRLAISGFSKGASHEFIIARSERIANMVFEIGETYGDEMAMLVMKSLPPDQSDQTTESPDQ